MATNTVNSFTNHTGNGSAGPFSISFSYLSESEVDVTVGGVLKTITTHYTFTSSTQITFTSGNEPGNGVAINIQRDTNISAKKVDFNDGSVLTELDLDTQNDQVLFAVQENLRKLDTIEEGATGDQTNAEIRTAVEAATDSNVFTDADHSKLNAIEASATADQTAAEIRTLVESASDSNVFTDADHTKLNGIEASATADQTNAEIRTAVEAATDSNVFTDADHSKLNAIEASATADQTGAEIKSAYEGESNTNAFTDAEKTKLGNLGSLNALSDVNTSGVADGKILKYQASSSSFIIADDGGSGGGGATAFTGLSDTPANFGSAASKTVKVNAAGNALEFVTVSTDIVNDTTPQLGGNLDVQASEITTSTTNGNIKLNPNGTGVVEVKGDGSSADGTLQLNCSQNSHGVKIKSPAHSAAASYTLTLPTNVVNGQFLKTDTNGVLSWAATDLLSDTSPQLGGTLDINGNSISFASGITQNLKTGATNAVVNGVTQHVLQGSLIIDGGTKDIFFTGGASGSKITFGSSDGLTHEVMRITPSVLGASQHGKVDLKYVTANAGGSTSSSTKLTTTSTGITVSGNVVLSNALLPSADSASDIGTTSVRWRNVYADDFYGSAANLTAIPAANITGTLPAIDGSNLTGVASTTGGGAIYENSATISASRVIPSGSNGMSAGPISVASGVTLTVSSGSVYTIV